MTHYVDDQGKGTVPFTPAVQVYYAFEEALNELLEEGVANRMQRYRRAATRVRERLGQLGIQALLPPESQSNTITAFHLPAGLTYRLIARSAEGAWLCHLRRAGTAGIENFPHCQHGRLDGTADSRVSHGLRAGARGRRRAHMRAVILAAGVGKRLWPVTQHKPKCLIDIGGQTLLSRYLEVLASVKIKDVDHRGRVQAGDDSGCGRQQNTGAPRIAYLVNEEFHRGSISSLWIARSALSDDVVDYGCGCVVPSARSCAVW